MMRYIILLMIAIVLVGCSNSNESVTETETVDVNPQLLELRNIDVQVEELQVLLSAEVNTLGEEIFYRIELGDEVLQEESEVKLTEGDEWKSFEIEATLSEDVVDKEDAPIVVIYGKGDNGEESNPNYIPIDLKNRGQS